MKQKFKIFLTVVSLIVTSAMINPIDAGFFDSLKGFAHKAAGAIKKVAHSDLGKIAIQMGGVAVASKFGDEARGLFENATQSLHLADQADSQADEFQQQGQQAQDSGYQDQATRHFQAAQLYRTVANDQRKQHAQHRRDYEAQTGSDFDDDYNQHVLPQLEQHARSIYSDEFNGSEDDDSAQNNDAGGDYSSDGDEGNDDDGSDGDDE